MVGTTWPHLYVTIWHSVLAKLGAGQGHPLRQGLLTEIQPPVASPLHRHTLLHGDCVVDVQQAQAGRAVVVVVGPAVVVVLTTGLAQLVALNSPQVAQAAVGGVHPQSDAVAQLLVIKPQAPPGAHCHRQTPAHGIIGPLVVDTGGSVPTQEPGSQGVAPGTYTDPGGHWFGPEVVPVVVVGLAVVVVDAQLQCVP